MKLIWSLRSTRWPGWIGWDHWSNVWSERFEPSINSHRATSLTKPTCTAILLLLQYCLQRFECSFLSDNNVIITRTLINTEWNASIPFFWGLERTLNEAFFFVVRPSWPSNHCNYTKATYCVRQNINLIFSWVICPLRLVFLCRIFMLNFDINSCKVTKMASTQLIFKGL